MTETNDDAAPADPEPEDHSTGDVGGELGEEPAEDDAVSEAAEAHPDVVGPPNLAAALNVPAITRRE